MPTLTDILADIRVLTESLPSDVDAELAQYVRDAQSEAEDRHVFLAMEAELSATTALGTRLLVAKPSLWLRRLDVPYWLDGNTGHHTRMDWASTIGQIKQRWTAGTADADRGSPRVLLETLTELHVYPLPDQSNPVGSISATGDYPIVVPYVARLVTLQTSGADQSNWISDNMRDYLVARAASEAFFYTRDYDAAAVWAGKAQAHLARAVRLDKRSRFHQAETLEGVGGSRYRAGQGLPWR